jgi:hypothetical protein
MVGDTTSSTAIEIINCLKICSCKSKGVLEARVYEGRGIPYSKDSLSLKLVNGSVFKRYNRKQNKRFFFKQLVHGRGIRGLLKPKQLVEGYMLLSDERQIVNTRDKNYSFVGGRIGSRQSCACKRIQVACVSCLSLRLGGIEKALRAVSCIGDQMHLQLLWICFAYTY